MNPVRYLFIGLLHCSFISQNGVGPTDYPLTVKHVLEYTYTCFNSSHYEVAGLLDAELVDFYSSALKSPVPKKSWNENETTFGYREWQDSILARQDIHIYFLSSALDLRRHFGNHPGGDIVQMRLGCAVDQKTDKDFGFAEFAYDGNTMLRLSNNSKMWIPTDEDAHHIHAIVHKWNTQSMKDHFSNFVNVKCPVSLDRFRSLERTNSSAPEVYTEPGGSLKPGWINLTCLITGSYPKSSPIEINLFRDNILLTEMDGVHSSGVRPNEDHTYQLRKTVRINASESVVYRCDVNHKSFPKPRNYTWEVKSQEKGSYLQINLIVFGLCIFFVSPAVVLFFKNRSEINVHLAAPNPEEKAALGSQERSLTDQGGDATSVDRSSERDGLTNDPDAEDEAYGSRGSSDSDLSQIKIT